MTDAALRTHVYAPPRSLGQAAPCLPPKAAHTRRSYVVDFSGLLRMLGQASIADAAIQAQAPLLLDAASHDAACVTFHLGGGAVGTPPAQICIALLFGDGSREDVALAQPIHAALPDIPDDPVVVNSQPVTVAYQPVSVEQLQLLPGGTAVGDRLLAYRPGAPGLLGLLPPGAGGGGAIVTDYVHTQALPSATWTIAHNLGRHPLPRVVTSSGDLVEGDVHYVDASTMVLTFAASFAGTAYL